MSFDISLWTTFVIIEASQRVSWGLRGHKKSKNIPYKVLKSPKMSNLKKKISFKYLKIETMIFDKYFYFT